MDPLAAPLYRRSLCEWGPASLRDTALGIVLSVINCTIILVLWAALASLGTLIAYWFDVCSHPTPINTCGLTLGTAFGAIAAAVLLLLIFALHVCAVALARLWRTHDRL